ncbi:MAG: hypothetical protein KGH71_03125 [Candidatus Micrarchaeota archaeon]|nr:hypothetical protein [Candidatus Micrarchaeota archaeon]
MQKAKMSLVGLIYNAQDSTFTKEKMNRMFEGFDSTQLEKVARSPYLSEGAQEALAMPGRYRGIYLQLINNPDVVESIKERLRKIEPQPVKIFTVVEEGKKTLGKTHRK